jgi:hypothetical protein
MRYHVLTLFLVLRASVAVAQGAPSAQAGADAEFAAGQQEFQAKHYGLAAKHFMVAFERVSNPLYLFNAAQAYRLDGNCYEAWEKYNSFYIQVKDQPVNGLDRVKEYLTQLQDCHDKHPAGDNPANPPQPPQLQPQPVAAQPPMAVVTPPAPPPSNAVAYALTVGGVVVLGLAVGAQVHEDGVYSAGQKFQSSSDCIQDGRAICNARLQSVYNNRGEPWSTVADVAYPVGGLALLAGLGLIILHHGHAQEHMVMVAPTPQGGEVVASWHF